MVAESSSHCLCEACLTLPNEHAGIPEQDTPISTVQALSACEGCRRCQTVHPAAVQAVKMHAQLEWAQAQQIGCVLHGELPAVKCVAPCTVPFT